VGSQSEAPKPNGVGAVRISPGFSFGLAAVGAAASVLCIRTGFFSFFFLLPLGMAFFFGDAKTAWVGGILATALNIIISLWLYRYRHEDPLFLQWNAVYYSAMVIIFTWINAPLGNFALVLETPYRIALGAVLCTILLAPIFLSMMGNTVLYRLVADRLAAYGDPSASTAGVPRAEELVTAMIYAGLRGGILVSCMIFWWVNRQLAAGVVRIARYGRAGNPGLPVKQNFGFNVPFFVIWIFSLSLGAVLLGKIAALELLEIGGWNILALSGILYLVQGGSIAFLRLAKLPPLLRILIGGGVILLLFRPGVNLAALGLLVILGIAENWVPFRAPKK
jgi:hypothetical protein